MMRARPRLDALPRTTWAGKMHEWPLILHPRTLTREPGRSLDAARDVLRRTFGHADFRGLQAGVIGEVLAGRSALAVLPTGGGKSLCYQIPALVRPGLGLVVSPLIALMADQVAALQQSGRGGRAAGLQHRARASAPTSGGGSTRARWTCSTCRPKA